MAEVPMKVLASQPLRKEPRDASGKVVSPGPFSVTLQVQRGETVKTGAKPPQEEATPEGKITWIFVEATEGQHIDLRKGYVTEDTLVSVETSVERSTGFKAFVDPEEKERFADACIEQATLNGTNPAYLYALASALSGDHWSPTHVTATESAGGVFRFSATTWPSVLSNAGVGGLQPGDIKFPIAQCIVAAAVAAKAADKLKDLIK